MNQIDKLLDDSKVQSILSRLGVLFRDMDDAYSKISQAHGFQCQGCEENCCETWFFHHTLCEFLYIARGCRSLSAEQLEEARRRSADILATVRRGGGTLDDYKVMCPLNFNGKCALYEYRPMICRLHGVRHQLVLPNGVTNSGPGCKAFEKLAEAGGNDAVLDRSPFYRELSSIERDMRTATGFGNKIKLTVAEMLESL